MTLLGQKDASLSKIASEYVPPVLSQKRKSTEPPPSPGKKRKANKNSELAVREVRAMEMLETFVQERGGQPSMVSDFVARVTRKASGKYESVFYSPQGRRFRSMLEVGRFFKLVRDGGRLGKSGGSRKLGKRGTKSEEAEKKKLRKELERLRKAHQRATKALDDFSSQDKSTQQPVEDHLLVREELKKDPSLTVDKLKATCAAARKCDIEGFPGVPNQLIPDILMSWDFLCTFQRALSLTPIGLDDFCSALAYKPPKALSGDDVQSPPVYIAEAHLALLKLLLSDRTSEDWWWSTLESDQTHLAQHEESLEQDGDDAKPVIRVNMAALFAAKEDPLITASWLRALQDVGKNPATLKALVATALKVVSNRYVKAYLKKATSLLRAKGLPFVKSAIGWLVHTVREARPELFDSSVKNDSAFEQRARVLKEASAQVEALPATAPSVTDEDAASDEEEEDDDESDDDSDDEGDEESPEQTTVVNDAEEKPAPEIPPRPPPTLTDLLLPPEKPHQNVEYLNSFTWPHFAGASVSRIVHRKKRDLNRMDDKIRISRNLVPLNIVERRTRESRVIERVLTESAEAEGSEKNTSHATEYLCSGGDYLDLSIFQRLSMLRLLIEAAYDSFRVHEVVDGNYKQRASAMKSLDQEQRKARKEAKEKAAADDAAAREALAAEAREKFMDEKREEIRQLNERSKEFDDEFIESLTEEDILDFDEDIKEDFELLRGPDSFTKAEVAKMVATMWEEAAFDTDALRVISLEDLLGREKVELSTLRNSLEELGGELALEDPSLDRETVRAIEKHRADIERVERQLERLPELRDKALEQLRDAMSDGTIKVLRTAIVAAKKAKLSGPDDETGGIWAVDLVRDAALELDRAKQNKRVVDARKDLIAKRNKCFIRTEPLGTDKFGNRFWSFDNAENGQVWVETEWILSDSPTKASAGFSNLEKSLKDVVVGCEDLEKDIFCEQNDCSRLTRFSRLEFHSSGSSRRLVSSHWGCQVTESSLRTVIKGLDSRGFKESELKSRLKDSLEETVGDKNDSQAEEPAAKAEADENEVEDDSFLTSGDEAAFSQSKREAKENEDVSIQLVGPMKTAIGASVRVRKVVDETKDSSAARYENGKIVGWKLRTDQILDEDAMEDEFDDPVYKDVKVAVWKVDTDRGHSLWIEGASVLEGISRHDKLSSGKAGDGFENDAVFLAYRNAMGRYCGRAADAPYCASPIFLARLMVKRESELYPKLKIRSYDNEWGGQSGQRALWTNSMKDYAFDFDTARQGLLTLEQAFFELTGGFKDYSLPNEETPDAKALLDDPVARDDLELESIEKDIPGLWNKPESRAVFVEIVSRSKTTGFLALALDLLCRNTTRYLQHHKLLNTRTSYKKEADVFAVLPPRKARRLNAWQEASNRDDWY